MQMVLVLGAQPIMCSCNLPNKSCQNSYKLLALSQRLEKSACSPTSAPVSCARCLHLCVGRLCSGSCLSVHLFVITGDFLHNTTRHSRCHAEIWVSCTLVWVRDWNVESYEHHSRRVYLGLGSAQVYTMKFASQHLFCGGWLLNSSDVKCSTSPHTIMQRSRAHQIISYQCHNSRSPFREQLPQSKLS